MKPYSLLCRKLKMSKKQQKMIKIELKMLKINQKWSFFALY
jgi:hypothetical protein